MPPENVVPGGHARVDGVSQFPVVVLSVDPAGHDDVGGVWLDAPSTNPETTMAKPAAKTSVMMQAPTVWRHTVIDTWLLRFGPLART